MKDFKAYYDGKTIIVQANSSYDAQCLARVEYQSKQRKNVKQHMITVCLDEPSAELHLIRSL